MNTSVGAAGPIDLTLPVVGPALCAVILLAMLPFIVGRRTRRWWLILSVAIIGMTVVAVAVVGHSVVELETPPVWLFVILWSVLTVASAAVAPILLSERVGVYARVGVLTLTIVGSVVGSIAGLASAAALGCTQSISCAVRLRATPSGTKVWSSNIETRTTKEIK